LPPPERAPDTYKVTLATSKGDFSLEVNRDWAPRGADRFYRLVRDGFFDGARFFRVLPGFVVQFGISQDPAMNRLWREQRIPDDPVKESNRRGAITFATSGPNSRTTQVFINLGDNRRLDGMGFAAFGRVVAGMNVVEELYSGYGEGAPGGKGPAQEAIQTQGGPYLERNFPLLDHIRSAAILMMNTGGE